MALNRAVAVAEVAGPAAALALLDELQLPRHHLLPAVRADLLHRLDRLASALPHSLAKLECVLRPALLDLDGPMEGFALTLYVKGTGVDAEEAELRWANALKDVTGLFRTPELHRL